MENYNKYNRQEMEERLPAYIFGELPDMENERFELSLEDFPDIQDEIRQVRNTFELLDKIDYEKVLFDKTKDIPSRVARHVAKSNTANKRSFLSFRFLLPAFITAAIMFVVIKTGVIDNYWNNIKHTNINKLSSNDINNSIDEIFADNEVQNEIKQTNDYEDTAFMYFNDDDIDQIIDYYYQQFIFSINSYVNTTNSPYIETYLTLNTNIENIDEETFEQIIEEIKNANL